MADQLKVNKSEASQLTEGKQTVFTAAADTTAYCRKMVAAFDNTSDTGNINIYVGDNKVQTIATSDGDTIQSTDAFLLDEGEKIEVEFDATLQDWNKLPFFSVGGGGGDYIRVSNAVEMNSVSGSYLPTSAFNGDTLVTVGANDLFYEEKHESYYDTATGTTYVFTKSTDGRVSSLKGSENSGDTTFSVYGFEVQFVSFSFNYDFTKVYTLITDSDSNTGYDQIIAYDVSSDKRSVTLDTSFGNSGRVSTSGRSGSYGYSTERYIGIQYLRSVNGTESLFMSIAHPSYYSQQANVQNYPIYSITNDDGNFSYPTSSNAISYERWYDYQYKSQLSRYTKSNGEVGFTWLNADSSGYRGTKNTILDNGTFSYATLFYCSSSSPSISQFLNHIDGDPTSIIDTVRSSSSVTYLAKSDLNWSYFVMIDPDNDVFAMPLARYNNSDSRYYLIIQGTTYSNSTAIGITDTYSSVNSSYYMAPPPANYTQALSAADVGFEHKLTFRTEYVESTKE